MVLVNSHRYVAEASDAEGRRLGEFELNPDFEPAAEWLHLQLVRSGAITASAHYGPGVIEPVIDEAHGRPFISGFRIRFDAQDPAYQALTIPWTYFQPSVETGAARLIREGMLHPGEGFVYRICVFPLSKAGQSSVAAPLFAEEQEPVQLLLDPSALAPRIASADRAGQTAWNDLDFPVFVLPELLAEATALAQAAGECETGGILFGHLLRDTESPEVYAEITTQIPAALADAGHAHLGFTPEAWSAVSDALALRGLQESYLGWWHFHPFFCRKCDLARRRQCPMSRPFFSRDDCELHRAVFDTAFSVALLLSDVGEASLRYDWFGWRYGSIAARGCYLLNEDRSICSDRTIEDTAPAARILNVGENPHEQ